VCDCVWTICVSKVYADTEIKYCVDKNNIYTCIKKYFTFVDSTIKFKQTFLSH